jgi:hypothetical protein
MAKVRRYGASVAAGILLVSVNLCAGAEPPPGLARLAAERETAGEAARAQFAFKMKILFEEMDPKGFVAGRFQEQREVVFNAAGESVDRRIGKPVNTLVRLKLTDEDFDDLRNIQPLLLTKEKLWLYRTAYRGEEKVFDTPCWVLAVEPKQLLDGQRLFEGLVWIAQADYSVVQTEGRAVPQKLGGKEENLFPRFRTLRRPIYKGFWFPVLTVSDDVLPFRTGPLRQRMRIEYSDYQRFGTESILHFDLPPGLETPKP